MAKKPQPGNPRWRREPTPGQPQRERLTILEPREPTNLTDEQRSWAVVGDDAGPDWPPPGLPLGEPVSAEDERVRATFAVLADQERQVFLLHYIELLPVDEVAERLGLTPAAVLPSARRAREQRRPAFA